MAALSTRRSRPANATGGATLTKAELVRRVAKRAEQRYGQSFSEARLNELIKVGLMPAAERWPNEGRRPVFVYDFRAYRRALQLVRLRSRGVTDRTAATIQLFLSDYSCPAHLVRDALWLDYRRRMRAAFASTRSLYLGTFGQVPAGHLSRLFRSLGPLDPAFETAGFVMAPALVVDAARYSTAGQLDLAKPATAAKELVAAALAGESSWLALGQLALGWVDGLAQIDEAANDPGGPVDYVQRLIEQADPATLEAARELVQGVTIAARAYSDLVRFLGRAEREEEQVAFEKIGRARFDPNWASSLLVMALYSRVKFGPSLSRANIAQILLAVREGRFTRQDLLNIIAPR